MSLEPEWAYFCSLCGSEYSGDSSVYFCGDCLSSDRPDKFAQLHCELSEKKNDISAHLEACEAQLAQRLQAPGVYYTESKHEIIWRSYDGRKFDFVKFKREKPDLYEAFCKGEPKTNNFFNISEIDL